ncbi:glycerophosphodiester phosphodiesterase [Coralloluteibacterium thermophilus]|uniref:glycerophosphodiester phosphodiesterase n=2 Tax=Coralloluteibacterium thermophilum TaxID=2707049 RepID=A0ABV9NP45_9GAMM
MRLSFLVILAALAALAGCAAAPAPAPAPPAAGALVIAHRGHSAERPEHTLEAYRVAIALGADMVEPDLVMTRDGMLVARHENEIGGTTDVGERPEFASRRTTRTIDGAPVTGWFTEDFTLAELKTLRARERIPQLRPTDHDGRYEVPTWEEIVALVAEAAEREGRTIGLVPEIKHGSYFASIGLPMEDALLDAIQAHPYTRRAPVWIQSFEVANLRALRARLGPARGNVRLLQLLGAPDGRPWDAASAGRDLTYGAMATPAGLREVAGYADGIGPPSRLVIPLDADGALGAPTALVRDAHAAGLLVMPYTFRPENAFLPPALAAGGPPQARNPEGSVAEIRAHLDAGIDGFFSDDVALGRQAVDGRFEE